MWGGCGCDFDFVGVLFGVCKNCTCIFIILKIIIIIIIIIINKSNLFFSA